MVKVSRCKKTMKDYIKRIEVPDLIPAYAKASNTDDDPPNRLFCYLVKSGHLYLQAEYDSDPTWEYNPWHISYLQLSLAQMIRVVKPFQHLLAFI